MINFIITWLFFQFYVDCVTGTKEFIPSPAFTPKIGQLYDIRSGHFPEHKLISQSNVKLFSEDSPETSFYLEHSLIKSESDFFKVRTLDADMQLNVRLGFFSGSAEASFKSVADQKTSSKKVVNYMFYEQKIAMSSIDFCSPEVKSVLNMDMLQSDETIATHYVSGIIKGVSVDIFAEAESDTSEGTSKLEAQLKLQMSDVAGRFSGNLRGRIDSSSSCASSAEKYFLRVKANLPMSLTIPTSFNELVPYLQEANSNLNKTEGGKGSSLYVKISNLEELRGCLGLATRGTTYYELSSHLNVNISHALDAVATMNTNINDMLTDFMGFKQCFDIEYELKLKKAFAEAKFKAEKFKSELKSIMVNVRIGVNNEDHLEEAINEYWADEVSPTHIFSKLAKEFPHLDDKIKLYRFAETKNVTCVYANTSYIHQVYNKNTSFVHILEFNTFNMTQLLEEASRFVTNCQIPYLGFTATCLLMDCTFQTSCGTNTTRLFNAKTPPNMLILFKKMLYGLV